MIEDRFGGRHGTTSARAVAAFEDAVLGVAGHLPSIAASLETALTADPFLVAGHALGGFASIILARAELVAPARLSLEAARDALMKRGAGTVTELALVHALSHAVDGRLRMATKVLDSHLAAHPSDFLAIKTTHALRFMTGDAQGMLGTTGAVLPTWSPDLPGYGFLLGLHAFGLEETGDLDAAEAAGRAAVRHEPGDAWAIHAVAHVHETRGRPELGLDWIEATRASWSRCNNFAFHLAWHLGLFHLEAGRHETVLALYDAEIRPRPTDDFRDVANASSLLWRLQQEGVEVGHRWDELHILARARRADTTLVFASLHHLMGLVAIGDDDAACDLVANLEVLAATRADDQARVAADLGIDLARVIAGRARHGMRDLAQLASRLPALGGSHAQRDVFLRTLAATAAARGDRLALDRILAIRRRLKRDDRFVALVEARCASDACIPHRLSA